MEVTATFSPLSPKVVSSTKDEIKTNNDDDSNLTLFGQLRNAHQVKTKKMSRKRRHSAAEDSTVPQSSDIKNQSAKHRRQSSAYTRKVYAGDIILPTKFLLGGNIRDPLNLNSLLDENVNKSLNSVTPSSSPLPPRSSKINIVIPTDMTDPLGLNLDQNNDLLDNPLNDCQSDSNPPTNCVKQTHKKKKKRRKSQHEKVIGNTSQKIENASQTPKELCVSSSQKENLKAPKGRKSNSKLLNIEPDSSPAPAEQNKKQLSIAVPKVCPLFISVCFYINR